MGNKFGSATQAALDALGGAGTKTKKAAGTMAGSRYGSATTAALDALNPTAPAEQPQATNRYQNYLDMGSVVRDISGADKGAAISPQKIMEEFLRRQQNGTEPVAQLTNPENTGARIRRYEDNQQRLAALEEQAQPLYNQFRQENPTHVAGQRTALQQTAEGRALLQRMDALAQEQQQYERLYKSSDYGTDARKQADFPERAAVAPHEEDAEYIAVNFDRYTPSAEKVARIKADPTYADMTEPGTGIWSEKDALYQLDDTLRSAWTLHNKSGYKNMTDEERDTYNYLYETRGKEAAHQYLQDQIIDVDKRESQKRVENFATAYDNVGGVGKAALNLATVPASVYGGMVSAAGDTVSALGGKYNPYSGSHAMTEFAQTIRGKTAEEIAAGINNETVGAFASNTYQAILSAADSVLGAATMGRGYTVAMGAGAASSRAKELYEQGAGSIQVLQGSIASGVAETLFEYVSLDKLIKTGDSRTVKEWVTNILKQSFTEASEEVSTEIANKVSDALIRGSRSDHSRAAQAYIEAGETPENARRLAWRDDVLDVLWAGYGGAVSGGLSAAAYGGVGTLQNIQEVKQIGQAYLTEGSDGKTRLGDAMEIGLSNAHGTEALETAQRIQSQLQQGKQPTAYQIGKMLLESTTPRAMRARVIEADILDSARENGVDDKTARSVAALMVRADRAARFVSPETLQTTGENGGQYSILTDANGLVYVQADESIIPAGATDKDIAPILSDIIQNKFHNLIQANGQNIGINRYTSSEWRWSKSAQNLMRQKSDYIAKMEIFNNADEILRAAHSWINEQAKHKSSRGFVNFGRGQVAFKVGDQGYSADVVVGIQSGGTAYLYDIVDIKHIKINDTPNTGNTGMTGEPRRQGVSSDTRIPQNGAGVNTQYMQNSGENAPVYQAAGRYTADGVVELASNITTDEAMDFVIKHELTHAIEGSAAYEKIKALVQQSMGEAEYAAAVERERQSRSAKGDAQGATGAEAEVIADWVGENLYNGDIGTGFARMIRNMDRGAAVQFQAILDGFRQTLGLTKSYRQAAALRSAERAFAEVLDSDYSSADQNTAAETGDGGKLAYMNDKSFKENVDEILKMTDEEALRRKAGGQYITILEHTPSVILDNVEDAVDRKIIIRFDAAYLAARHDGALQGHYHNYGDGIAELLPNVLNNPDAILRMDNGRLNLMAIIPMSKGNTTVVSVELDTVKDINSRNDPYNLVVTMTPAKDNYIRNNIRNHGAAVEYIKDDLPQVNPQLYEWLGTINGESSSSTKIPQNGSGVNTQYMQNSENNSSDGQKSYLPADLQERENAAAPRSGINPDFEQEYNAWDKKSVGGYFVLGTTSEALQSIGIEPARIYWDKSKIKKILDNPNHHMENAIPKVPELLEHPILIMQSQTVLNRVVLLGEINDDLGYPVLCALELRPNGEINDFVKVASAYGKDSRGGVQSLIDTSDILYVDPNKNRTDSWLEARRLQLPVGLTNYGSIGRVTYFKKDVKGNFTISGATSQKTAMQTAFEKAMQHSTQSQSMQNGENNSSDGQKSYLPAELQERENAAAAEKAENARRLAEEQSEKQRQQETQTRRQREETAGERVSQASDWEGIVRDIGETEAVRRLYRIEHAAAELGDVEIDGERVTATDYIDRYSRTLPADKQAVRQLIRRLETEQQAQIARDWSNDGDVPGTLPIDLQLFAAKEQLALLEINEDGDKVRKFIETRLKGKDATNSPDYLEYLAGRQDTYDPIGNKETLKDAEQLLRNPNYSKRLRKRLMQFRPGDMFSLQDMAAAQVLIHDAIREGDFEAAVNLTVGVSRKATEAGRAVQILSMQARLTPEGTLRTAKRLVQQAADNATFSGMSEQLDGFAHRLAAQMEKAAAGHGLTPAQVETILDGLLNGLGSNQQQLKTLLWKKLKNQTAAPSANDTAGQTKTAAELLAAAAEGDGISDAQVKRVLEKQLGLPTLDEKDVETIVKLTQGIQKQADFTAEQAEAIEKLYDYLGKKLPVTGMEKWQAWRKLAMLANPKTHIRNMVSNVCMSGVQKADTVIGTLLENVFVKDKSQRSALIGWSLTEHGRKIRPAIDQATERAVTEMQGTGKFDLTASAIRNHRQYFKTKWLNWINETNSALLEKEDVMSFRPAYRDALGQLMTVRGTTEVTDELHQLAMQRALEATFRADNALHDTINSLKNTRFKAVNTAMDVVVPFSKTPANIMVETVMHSPIGLVKATADLFLRTQGKSGQTVAAICNEYAKALTGSVLMAIGLLLGHAGLFITKYAGTDKERAYYELAGLQENSLRIGRVTISLDWLQPTCAPLILGASLGNNLAKGGLNLSQIFGGVMDATDSLFELTMLQSLYDVAGGYNKGVTGSIASVFENLVSQSIPTLIGQTARIIDPVQRKGNGTSALTSVLGDNLLTTAIQQVMLRLPGFTYLLEPEMDIWGDTVYRTGKKSTGSAIWNGFQQILSPANVKIARTDDALNQAVASLYAKSGKGHTKALPSTLSHDKAKELEIDYTAGYKAMGAAQREAARKLISNSTRQEVTVQREGANGKTIRQKIQKYWDDMTEEERLSALARIYRDVQTQLEELATGEISKSDYDQITQAVLLAQKSNTKKKKEE